MASYNSAQVMGNLGSAPDLRFTKNGQPVASFRIAANRQWKDNTGAKKEETLWLPVTVWGAQAESCSKFLDKGSGVFVAGRLVNTEWEDKDGVKRYSIELHAQTVQFLPRGNGGGGRAPHPADRESSAGGPPDLPPPPEEESPGGF